MKNKIFLLIICTLVFSTILAQDTALEPEDKDLFNYNKVLVIPFNPDLYFSDADHDLAKYNLKSVEEVRTKFRLGLDFNVNARVLSKYDTKSFMTDTSEDVQADLMSIYTGISYKYETPVTLISNGEEKTGNGLLASANDRIYENENKKIINYKNYNSEAQGATSYIEPIESKKYMNAVVHNPEMLTYFSEKYGTDLFLFINQFEIKTKYEKCLDRAINNFTREILVHFTIFNAAGVQLYGDVVKVNFTVQTNDINSIIRNNFPLIGDYLSGNLPKKMKIN